MFQASPNHSIIAKLVWALPAILADAQGAYAGGHRLCGQGASTCLGGLT